MQPSVALLSLDRVAAAFFPGEYKARRTVGPSINLVAVLWMANLLPISSRLAVDWAQDPANYTEIPCDMDVLQQTEVISSIMFSVFVFCTSVILLCPVLLMWKLAAVKRVAVGVQPPVGARRTMRRSDVILSRRERGQERDNNFVLVMSTVACTCCFLPIDILFYIKGSWDAFVLLGLFNSIFNALIYQHTNISIRDSFKKICGNCRVLAHTASPSQATPAGATFHSSPPE